MTKKSDQIEFDLIQSIEREKQTDETVAITAIKTIALITSCQKIFGPITEKDGQTTDDPNE